MVGRSARGRKPAMVGRGCEYEAGSRPEIRALLSRVRACALVRAVLLCTDGLASYPKAAIHLFREPLRTPGKPGRPRLVLPEGVMVAQAVKRHAKRRVVGVIRRVVVGASEEAVTARLT